MQSITICHGIGPAFSSMLTRPISIILILMSIVSLVIPLYQSYKANKANR